MATFSTVVLTTQGQALYTKAQTGAQLNFTRMQLGSGQLAPGQDPTQLTALITPVSYFNINSTSSSGNTASVKGIFENTAVTQSTYVCELGLFATDPSTGNEILYAYANAGQLGDNTPPFSAGPLTDQYQLNVAIGNATNVTATIPSNTYIPANEMGVANGVATLDQNGQVPTSQLGNAPSPTKTSQQEIEITSTSQTVVTSHTPTTNGNYQVNIYLRVITGATPVTVTVNWTDASGNQTNTMISNQSLAVGSHSLTPLFFNALTAGEITVNVTAGTANQVYASSSITRM